jgi:hypothetical protein
MATEVVPTGTTLAMVSGQVYATPARACFVHSKAVVEISDEVGGTFVALTGSNTLGVMCGAAFVKSTTAGNFVTFKPY